MPPPPPAPVKPKQELCDHLIAHKAAMADRVPVTPPDARGPRDPGTPPQPAAGAVPAEPPPSPAAPPALASPALPPAAWASSAGWVSSKDEAAGWSSSAEAWASSDDAPAWDSPEPAEEKWANTRPDIELIAFSRVYDDKSAWADYCHAVVDCKAMPHSMLCV